MSAVLRGAPIHKHLSALQHTFGDEQLSPQQEQSAEQAALFRLDCQTYVGLFDVLSESTRDWRRRVFCGEEPFSEEVNQSMYDGFVRWLTLSDRVRRQMASMQARGIAFDEQLAANLESLTNKAQLIIAEWWRPKLSTAVGLRTRRVTREEANQLGWFSPPADGSSSR
jgi:hypothetical protein